jgi:hypothetical protein
MKHITVEQLDALAQNLGGWRLLACAHIAERRARGLGTSVSPDRPPDPSRLTGPERDRLAGLLLKAAVWNGAAQ